MATEYFWEPIPMGHPVSRWQSVNRLGEVFGGQEDIDAAVRGRREGGRVAGSVANN